MSKIEHSIGGSDVTRLLNGNWYDLYLEKMGEKEPEDLSDALPVQLGIETEKFNLGWFKDHTPEELWNGRDLEHQALYNVHGHKLNGVQLHGHTDGLIMKPRYPKESINRHNLGPITEAEKYENVYAVIECKHTNPFTNMNKVTDYYMGQMQLYMYLTKTDACYLSVIFGNSKWDYVKVAWSQEYFDKIWVYIKEFWDCLKRGEAPTNFEVMKPSSDLVPIDDRVRRDMSHDNEFMHMAHEYKRTYYDAKANAEAKKFLTLSVTDTDRELHCDLLSVHVSKTGRKTIKLIEE